MHGRSLQCCDPASYPSDHKILFHSHWTTLGPRFQEIGPPWSTLEGQFDHGVWPTGDYVEDDYSLLRGQAALLLANPVSSYLFEAAYSQHGAWGLLHAPSIAETWTSLQRSEPDDLSRIVRHRHQMAAYLLLLSDASIWLKTVPVQVDGQVLQANVWRFGFAALKLAWALMQPAGEGYDAEEASIDLMVALCFLPYPIRDCPESDNFLLSLIDVCADEEVQSLVRENLRGATVHEQHLYRRCLCHCARKCNFLRLWVTKDVPYRFAETVKELGGASTFLTNECIDELRPDQRPKIAYTRPFLHFLLARHRLALLVEYMLDSPLTEELPPRFSPAWSDSVRAKEDHGEALYERL